MLFLGMVTNQTEFSENGSVKQNRKTHKKSQHVKSPWVRGRRRRRKVLNFRQKCLPPVRQNEKIRLRAVVLNHLFPFLYIGKLDSFSVLFIFPPSLTLLLQPQKRSSSWHLLFAKQQKVFSAKDLLGGMQGVGCEEGVLRGGVVPDSNYAKKPSLVSCFF